MGFGASLSFIAIGAILAFALKIDLSGVNIQMVGWILILVGVASMIFTFAYTRPRRSAAVAEIADEEPLYVVHPEESAHTRPVHEPATAEAPVVERTIVERPVSPSSEPAPHTVRQSTESTRRPADPPQPGRHIEEGHSRIRREPL
ncbi:DUF6458 family protein [Thermomonospora cellulosilytica]|uniref:DUF6458 domain-containing protein n=1 Tax=Thermomonospora cellulosilytica TaxID=1411118 RepID=A0A7W3R7B6_9ACTN|nr:DUF6458 family protein [Thermomonospora cellulosilytica]MBA9002145.1 hypothetical protein [Thermomonospora cellulosilytica]